ncbi:MAG: exosortase E/protease, VPEID-CTERM system [Henriciella sp.]|nr:exosortase E/protease, VPEID-CTERM system [Henriciella sp.]
MSTTDEARGVRLFRDLFQQSSKRWVMLLGAVLLELSAVFALYLNESGEVCTATGGTHLCANQDDWIVRGFSVAAFLFVFAMARPQLMTRLSQELAPQIDIQGVVVHLLGMAMIALPVVMVGSESSWMLWALTWVILATGFLTALVGLCLLMARRGTWIWFFRSAGIALPVGGLIALFGLDIIAFIRPIGHWEGFSQLAHFLTRETFQACTTLLGWFGHDVMVNAETRQIIIGEFEIFIWGSYSGLEGFILITAYLLFYLWMFRDDLAFPRALLLLPIGIILSWGLNIIRISLLVWIGAFVSPDLAFDGFHSHAGWLGFTLLAVSLAFLTHRNAWFRTRPAGASGPAPSPKGSDLDRLMRRPVPPFFNDPYMAQIAPFIALMGLSLALATFTAQPVLLFPVAALILSLILLLFSEVLIKLSWRFDPVPVIMGLAIGWLWVVTAAPATAQQHELAQTLSNLGPVWLSLWIAGQIIGLVLVVPLVEELFFRGYVLRRFPLDGAWKQLFAIMVSAALFAVLYERWLIAALAGFVFGILMLRKGRVTDAIVGHSVMAGVIAAWMVWTGNWTLI